MFNHRIAGLSPPRPKRRYKKQQTIMSSETGLAEARRMSPSPAQDTPPRKSPSSGNLGDLGVVDESDDVKVKEVTNDHITADDHEEKQKEPDQVSNPTTATPTTPTPRASKSNESTSTTDPGIDTLTITTSLSAEEQAVHSAIQKEQKAMNQCLQNMVESLNGLEADSQSKTTKITQIFDALIQQMNDRKNAMIHELQNDVLEKKEKALHRINSVKEYQMILNTLSASYQSFATDEVLPY